MYRFGNSFKSRLSYFHRQLSHEKILKTTLATSVGVVYAHYSLNTSYCETARFVPEPTKVVLIEPKRKEVEVIKHEEKGMLQSAWESLLRRASKAMHNISTSLRYMQRILTYALFGAPLVGLVPANYLFGNQIPQIENMTWGYLTWAIQQLGPCFIKLAQWASTRPDVFPPKLIEHLESLQDAVKIVQPISVVEKTLTEAFGEKWKNKLVVDYNPIGTGSVAQVFKGQFKQMNPKTNQEENIQVAIKMIHPHVEKLIKVDMELFNVVANFLDMFPSLELLSLGESCREFSKSMKQQLDLRVEANHLIHFTKNFMTEKWAAFPKPIDHFVTKTVMVETFMEGTPISYFMKLSDDVSTKVKSLKMKLSDLGSRLVIKMVFFDNYVHGDLHPGKDFLFILFFFVVLTKFSLFFSQNRKCIGTNVP
jgi:predicted unusual protein kinase regulating ubiquinone biosynthesis (AarF/ABC1/UbiB family)